MREDGDFRKAIAFAALAHEGQVRKYTGEPYIDHCAEVCEILDSAEGSITPAQRRAAMLHDTVEDTWVRTR